MGIFDRFKSKKNNANNQNENISKNDSIDLSNPVIKKMVEWIEHPMEFGKKPIKIEIVNERILFWPNNQKEKCYLLRFTVDNEEYLGFTGPITWCFFGIDFKKLSFDDMYERYVGWYIAFYNLQSDTYEKEKEGLNEKKVIDDLMKTGLFDIQVIQKVYLGGETYYEFTADEGGKKIKIVGTEGNMSEFDINYVLPFYQRIGIDWDPLSI